MNTVYHFPSIVFPTLVTITTFICSKMLVGFVPVKNDKRYAPIYNVRGHRISGFSIQFISQKLRIKNVLPLKLV
jgi:hypothetical protein